MRYSLLLISICLLSCQTDSTLDPVSKASFIGTVNGNEILVIENGRKQFNDSSIICTPSSSRSTGPKDKTIYSFQLYLGGLIYDKVPKNSISIAFVNHLSNSQIDADNIIKKEVLNDVFSLGNKSYSANCLEQPGVLIEWYDSNRHKWTTNKYMSVSDLTKIPGNPNFANSSFKIVKSISLSTPSPSFYKYSQYLEIAFNCNFYDSNGDSIKMTNAHFKGIFLIFKI